MSLIGKRRRSPDFDQLPDDELTILLQDFDDVVESLNERIRCPICFGLLRSAVLLSGCLHTCLSSLLRNSVQLHVLIFNDSQTVVNASVDLYHSAAAALLAANPAHPVTSSLYLSSIPGSNLSKSSRKSGRRFLQSSPSR